MIAAVMVISILLSTVRNILSKNISGLKIGTRQFFASQVVSFGCGSIALVVMSCRSFFNIAFFTVCCAIVYGILLLAGQYSYICALKSGKVGVCSTVYSLGFIIPTLSGYLFWHEPLSFVNFVGILLAIPTVILCGSGNVESKGCSGKGYIPLLLTAMLCSGGLGVMQKVQQTSAYSDQKTVFVAIAFVFATVVSLILALLAKPDGAAAGKKIYYASGIGTSFAFVNLFNTTLVGRMDSSVFFPLYNVSNIILCLISGMIIYKEKCSKKDIAVILLGAAVIVLVTR